MFERSKKFDSSSNLRKGAWVRIPLLTLIFFVKKINIMVFDSLNPRLSNPLFEGYKLGIANIPVHRQHFTLPIVPSVGNLLPTCDIQSLAFNFEFNRLFTTPTGLFYFGDDFSLLQVNPNTGKAEKVLAEISSEAQIDYAPTLLYSATSDSILVHRSKNLIEQVSHGNVSFHNILHDFNQIYLSSIELDATCICLGVSLLEDGIYRRPIFHMISINIPTLNKVPSHEIIRPEILCHSKTRPISCFCIDANPGKCFVLSPSRFIFKNYISPNFKWTQHGTLINLEVEIDCNLDVFENKILVIRQNGKIVFRRALYETILNHTSEDRTLQLECISSWPTLFKDEVDDKHPKFISKSQNTNENIILDDEDIDFGVESFAVTDVHTGLWESGTNFLGLLQKEDTSHVNLVLANGNDAVNYRFDCLQSDSFIHTETFPALAYVQGSKREKKYLLFTSRFAIVIESRRNIYIYCKPEDLKHSTHASQYIETLSLEEDDFVIGHSLVLGQNEEKNTVLYLLTKLQLISIDLSGLI